MEDNIASEFKIALKQGKYHLALTIIENSNSKTLQLLWVHKEKPLIIDNDFSQVISATMWKQFHKQLHQRVFIHVFTSIGIILAGCAVILWGIIDIFIHTNQTSISSFCLIPIGVLFLIGGLVFLVTMIRWKDKVTFKRENKK